MICFRRVLFLIISLIFLGQAQNRARNPHGTTLKMECSTCHTTSDFNTIDAYKFNHDRTGYPLIGQHRDVPCGQCHQSLVFNRVGVSCIDCHADIHQNELGIRCETCHTTAGWENRMDMLDAHSATNFPLVGVHANLECASCHGEQTTSHRFSNTPVDCQGCHLTNFMKTLSPSHQKAGFDLDCQKCHLPNTSTWKGATFDHTMAFPLSGGHANLECVSCHSNGYGGTKADCYDCHRRDYEQTSDPGHLTFGFPTVCQQCHSSETWQRGSFDHLETSGFELTGAHQQARCLSCHVNNQLSGLPRDCFGCHNTDFNSVSDPNHQTNNFSHDCTTCHSTTAWEPATFDHANTNFQLTGAHTSVNCVDCHSNGYKNTPSDCWSCHSSAFNAVSDPNHQTNNFSHDCTTCHSTSAWEPATFDHANTNFQLTGAHTSVNCVDCHSNGYKNTPSDCWSCHSSAFNAVSDPNHQTNNFSHDCTTCHSTSAWEPATFDHANTDFPLTGAHKQQECSSCHGNGYSNTPTECVSCHKSDYDNVTDPNHIAAGFPTTCESCHSTSRWDGATFDHDSKYFPIYSGEHRGEWNTCSDCHVDKNNFARFECINCHEHNQTKMDDKHKEVSGYVYSSVNCYSCHPNGKGD